MHDWLTGRPPLDRTTLSAYATHVLEMLERRGASFFHELVAASGLLATQVEQALAELAGLGMVTSDGFAGLRTLITPSNKRKPLITGTLRRTRTVAFGLESAAGGGGSSRTRMSTRARVIASLPVRGRCSAGTVSSSVGCSRVNRTHPPGAIFSWPTAGSRREARSAVVALWRGFRASNSRCPVPSFGSGHPPDGAQRITVGISAADPLNLTGIVTPGERVPALTGNRILYEDGVPVMALIAGQVKPLGAFDIDRTAALTQSLIRRPLAPALRARLAMSGSPAASVSLTERGGDAVAHPSTNRVE